jgi:protocatechuate 4,5-dioxygenase alpha chain
MAERVHGGLVFTGEMSQAGYRMNRMAMSLTDAANRDAFRADEDGYMRKLGLTEAERGWIAARDWRTMLENGASIYLAIKIAGTLGITLPEVGTQTAGITMDEWRARPKPAFPSA